MFYQFLNFINIKNKLFIFYIPNTFKVIDSNIICNIIINIIEFNISNIKDYIIFNYILNFHYSILLFFFDTLQTNIYYLVF